MTIEITHFTMLFKTTKNYLWDVGDKVGSSTTSDVYKACNITTREQVIAKVPKLTSLLFNIEFSHRTDNEDKDYSHSIFVENVDFLKNINHDNIARFIGTEIITSSDNSNGFPNQEILFFEYCNGGSVHDMLQLPANVYGLPEDIIIQIMKDIINALKYLHNKKSHCNIKPSNIMRTIDINNKVIYKLTDLVVNREIKQDEVTSNSSHDTEKYVHPIVYHNNPPDRKVNSDGNIVGTHVSIPFEIEIWSFGVTLYQCSTGQLPFQPYNSTNNDRNLMKQILTSIPMGSISGIQDTYNGDIRWSKVLPEWCRLSSNLKKMLEKLFSCLFETNQARLMKHEEFFNEVNKIIDLIPIYYINLKKFTLTCAYFQADDSIHKFFDYIRQENDDEMNVEYFCLFQNVYYPVLKTEETTVKTFCEQLPMSLSYEKPLIIYTFSISKFDYKCISEIHIPKIQLMENIQDIFASVYDWSQKIVGLFFYLQTGVIQYESIMQIIQSTIMTVHRLLKSKLLELLYLIRKNLLNHQITHELEKIFDLIKPQSSPKPIRSCHKSIIRSSDTNETSEEQNFSKIRPMLDLSLNFYHKLIEYNKDLSTILDTHFNDNERLFRLSNLSTQMKNYSMYIQQINKHVQDATDLCERFRHDTTITRPSQLQMVSNIIRQKNLKKLYDQYIHFVNEGCYPLILEFYNEFKKWIKQQADIYFHIQQIQFVYEYECSISISIDNFRQVINDELQKLSHKKNHLSDVDSKHTSNIQQLTTVQIDESLNDSNRTYTSNNILMNNLHLLLQKTIEQTENNSDIFNAIIKQLQQ
ncbi:unnamed protein product [Adineta steineri]|uniref:Protein kinase domain-containing protein n=1 Tax=Adineta steineri TaxID=433720 RepID=A0A818MWB0_9BILA|nr:unnamed protein product [Adineta steineri]